MIAYLDSSVLLRVVLGQPDALPDWSRVEVGVTSALTEVECLRTLDRLRLTGSAGEEQLALRRQAMIALLKSVEVVELAPLLLRRACQPFPVTIGTLDALHLATALAWRDVTGVDLTMATHDAALGMAARAMGLDCVGC